MFLINCMSTSAPSVLCSEAFNNSNVIELQLDRCAFHHVLSVVNETGIISLVTKAKFCG